MVDRPPGAPAPVERGRQPARADLRVHPDDTGTRRPAPEPPRPDPLLPLAPSQLAVSAVAAAVTALLLSGLRVERLGKSWLGSMAVAAVTSIVATVLQTRGRGHWLRLSGGGGTGLRPRGDRHQPPEPAPSGRGRLGRARPARRLAPARPARWPPAADGPCVPAGRQLRRRDGDGRRRPPGPSRPAHQSPAGRGHAHRLPAAGANLAPGRSRALGSAVRLGERGRRAPRRLLRWSFWRSFHRPQLHPTRPG
jgi:hypothetical protein